MANTPHEDLVVSQEYASLLWWVSTVFIGWGMADDPKPFETMVFAHHPEGVPEKFRWLDEYQRRHRTWTEAQIEHDEIVALVRLETSVPIGS